MSSLRRHEGHLLIDNRNSPGVSAEFVRRAGIDAPVVGAGTTFESATITCAHCHRVVILNPGRTRERHYCARCDHYICDGCAVTAATSLEHKPFAAVLDEAEAAAVRAEQADKSTIWLPSPHAVVAGSHTTKE